jgi:F-type H+-transporting ATPase subunit delta
MSEFTTLARPYARAAFELAREKGRFDEWSDQLGLLARVVQDPSVGVLLESPRLTDEQRADLLLHIGKDRIDQETANLVRLLAENDRLNALPEIAAMYEQQRAASEGCVEAEVISAFALDQQEERELAEALKRRFGSDVRLECKTDDSLLGGVLVRVGDTVIDGSIRGRLQRMAATLSR